MRERVRSDWTPWHGGGNGHWQPPLEKRASTARKKPFRGAKPGIWNARSWACIPRKASFKTAGAVTTAGLTVQDAVPRKGLPAGQSVKKTRHLFTLPATQPRRAATEIMKMCHWSLPGMTLKDHTLREHRGGRKKYGIPYRQQFQNIWRDSFKTPKVPYNSNPNKQSPNKKHKSLRVNFSG